MQFGEDFGETSLHPSSTYRDIMSRRETNFLCDLILIGLGIMFFFTKREGISIRH